MLSDLAYSSHIEIIPFKHCKERAIVKQCHQHNQMPQHMISLHGNLGQNVVIERTDFINIATK